MSLPELPKLLRTSAEPVHKCYLSTGFTEVLNNFGRSDDEIFSEKIMISCSYIRGFMHKKSWIVSKLCLASANSCNTKDVFEWLNTQVVRIFHPRWIAMVGIWHFNDLFVKLRRRTVFIHGPLLLDRTVCRTLYSMWPSFGYFSTVI